MSAANWARPLLTAFLVICVALDASRQQDPVRARRIWTLLADLYSANLTLSDFAEDQRRIHAAELIVSAWKVRSSQLSSQGVVPNKPAFVLKLETNLVDYHTKLKTQKPANVPKATGTELPITPAATVSSISSQTPGIEALESDTLLYDRYFDDLATIDFDQIDWTFWNSADGVNTDTTTWPVPS